MKNNTIIIGLLIIVLASCLPSRHIPSVKEIDVNEFGSYIVIKQEENKLSTVGELIAVDSSSITLFERKSKECIIVPINKIEKFNLIYAQPKNYFWTIPVFTLATIPHQLLMVYTLIPSLVTTILVYDTGLHAYEYRDKHITYEELRMFARFPQGIPSCVDLESIRNEYYQE